MTARSVPVRAARPGVYEATEHAADWLSDHEFPVERVSIVGSGLRYVEPVSGRVTRSDPAPRGLLVVDALGCPRVRASSG